VVEFEKLSAYASSFTSAESDLLKEMEAKAREIYIPILHPSAMAFIQQLIRWIKATRILELGTAIGYSAIRMRIAAGSESTIFTVERDRDCIAEAAENIRKMGFTSSIRIVEGDATEPPFRVRRAAPFDFILIDAAKAQYEHLFAEYAAMLRPGGMIVTDNIFFHGLVCDIPGVKKKQLRRLVEKVDAFNHFLARQRTFQTVFLTVGDGLAVSTKLA
jgi:predicted O-methyltransferase YrrM